jgi:hypothetical protein
MSSSFQNKANYRALDLGSGAGDEKGFEEVGQKLVFYGWGISQEDYHIVERLQHIQNERKNQQNNITKKPIESIAVSVYQDGDEQKFKKHVKDMLKSIATDIDFFDSSQGCWCFL